MTPVKSRIEGQDQDHGTRLVHSLAPAAAITISTLPAMLGSVALIRLATEDLLNAEKRIEEQRKGDSITCFHNPEQPSDEKADLELCELVKEVGGELLSILGRLTKSPPPKCTFDVVCIEDLNANQIDSTITITQKLIIALLKDIDPNNTHAKRAIVASLLCHEIGHLMGPYSSSLSHNAKKLGIAMSSRMIAIDSFSSTSHAEEKKIRLINRLTNHLIDIKLRRWRHEEEYHADSFGALLYQHSSFEQKYRNHALATLASLNPERAKLSTISHPPLNTRIKRLQVISTFSQLE